MRPWLKQFNLRNLRNLWIYVICVNSWCAGVDELPGVYAQADTIEDVRSELAEIIEEYVFVSLQEGHPLPEFKDFRKVA